MLNVPSSNSTLVKLFSEALSFGAVYGSAMYPDEWDKLREKKAQEFAEKASGVSDALMDGSDSMFGLAGDMA